MMLFNYDVSYKCSCCYFATIVLYTEQTGTILKQFHLKSTT